MPRHRVCASAVVRAPAGQAYAILADYRHGHPQIVPRPPFGPLEVERGGTGAGTVIRFQMRLLGRTRAFRAAITESEPGRVLVETDLGQGAVTAFTVDPWGGGRTLACRSVRTWRRAAGHSGSCSASSPHACCGRSTFANRSSLPPSRRVATRGQVRTRRRAPDVLGGGARDGAGRPWQESRPGEYAYRRMQNAARRAGSGSASATGPGVLPAVVKWPRRARRRSRPGPLTVLRCTMSPRRPRLPSLVVSRRGRSMDTCPHCGASLPPVRDAFCQECFQALDEPPQGSSASDAPAGDRRPLVGLLCGAALGLLSGCGTMTVVSSGGGLVGAAGAVAGQILAGAFLGFLVGSMIGRTR
jgi:hypothetical protein